MGLMFPPRPTGTAAGDAGSRYDRGLIRLVERTQRRTYVEHFPRQPVFGAGLSRFHNELVHPLRVVRNMFASAEAVNRQAHRLIEGPRIQFDSMLYPVRILALKDTRHRFTPIALVRIDSAPQHIFTHRSTEGVSAR